MIGFRNLAVATGLATAMVLAPSLASAETTLKDADDAVARLKKVEPGLKRFFEKSAGYAVFPDVAKGGFIVGGAGGGGFVYENGNPIGKTSLSQATVGAQIGGQAYIEIIFFENAEALAAFKKGEWAMAAQVSAVAVKAGAAKNASYDHGVAVFTLIKGGAMAEASVGGQKFSYEPLGAKK
jgi:lipid-binding SYLF domain-containing protein